MEDYNDQVLYQAKIHVQCNVGKKVILTLIDISFSIGQQNPRQTTNEQTIQMELGNKYSSSSILHDFFHVHWIQMDTRDKQQPNEPQSGYKRGTF